MFGFVEAVGAVLPVNQVLHTAVTYEGFWYLYRARNNCGTGTYGFETAGSERLNTACD